MAHDRHRADEEQLYLLRLPEGIAAAVHVGLQEGTGSIVITPAAAGAGAAPPCAMAAPDARTRPGAGTAGPQFFEVALSGFPMPDAVAVTLRAEMGAQRNRGAYVPPPPRLACGRCPPPPDAAVELPCIVESHKTLDPAGATYYKNGDIAGVRVPRRRPCGRSRLRRTIMRPILFDLI